MPRESPSGSDIPRLCECWQGRDAARIYLMHARRLGELSLIELLRGGREFGLPTLARLVTLRVIVRRGELMAPRNR